MTTENTYEITDKCSNCGEECQNISDNGECCVCDFADANHACQNCVDRV